MKAGWTSLGEFTPARRAAHRPWAGGEWRFTTPVDGTSPAVAAHHRRQPEPAPETAVAATAVVAAPAVTPPRRRGRRTAALFLVAALAGAAGGILAESIDDAGVRSDTVTVIGTEPSQTVHRSPESVAGVAASVLPSVVSVRAADAEGSGFVIGEEGYVLTNHHVIAAADDEAVALTLFDGREFEAELVGASPSYDLAVLRVEADNLQPVVFGDSGAVAVGDPVVAIGSPLGLDATVTSGIVSAVERPVTAGGDQSSQAYINALQTDAAINPGNSGGPLVDISGRVIGVTSAIASVGGLNASGSIGLGFAIPVEQVKRTAEQLISTGEAVYPVMGVLLDNSYNGQGARVAPEGESGPGVSPGGPADDVDIRPGDVIVAIDGEGIRGAAELIVRLRAHEPGDEITLVVERDGDTLEFTLTLGKAVG